MAMNKAGKTIADVLTLLTSPQIVSSCL